MSDTRIQVLERLTNDIPDRYDVSPGSYTYDVEMPVAMEFENAYSLIEYKEQQAYVSTATGSYLRELVREYGMDPKEAQAATGYVTITGTPGAAVCPGDKVAAGNIIFNITLGSEIGSDGTVTLPVVCAIASATGNVSAGAINRFPVTLSGLTSVTNTEATTGGCDAETDEEIKTRFSDFTAHPVTPGSKWWYVAQAKAQEGVGDAKCVPLWDGPGTVQVIIVGEENQAAGADLINKVQTFFDDNRLIGADITVASAPTVKINIACNLVYEGDVLSNLKENLTKYLQSVSFADGYVSHAKIGQVILETSGVIDHTDLTINGNTQNIPIAGTEIAVLGGVSVDGT